MISLEEILNQNLSDDKQNWISNFTRKYEDYTDMNRTELIEENNRLRILIGYLKYRTDKMKSDMELLEFHKNYFSDRVDSLLKLMEDMEDIV